MGDISIASLKDFSFDQQLNFPDSKDTKQFHTERGLYIGLAAASTGVAAATAYGAGKNYAMLADEYSTADKTSRFVYGSSFALGTAASVLGATAATRAACNPNRYATDHTNFGLEKAALLTSLGGMTAFYSAGALSLATTPPEYDTQKPVHDYFLGTAITFAGASAAMFTASLFIKDDYNQNVHLTAGLNQIGLEGSF